MTAFHSHARRVICATLVASLAMPGTAFADVLIDDTLLEAGTTAIGGGTATYLDSTLDLFGVTANNVSTNEKLTVNFAGDNDIDLFSVTDEAYVQVNFDGENAVEDLEVKDKAILEVNMNEHNEFEDLEAHDESVLLVNVDGEVSCEAIKGYDDAEVIVSGVNGREEDVLSVGEGESSERVGVEDGNLCIQDVTIVLCSEEAQVSSEHGDVELRNAKIISGEDNKQASIYAGGKLTKENTIIRLVDNNQKRAKQSGHKLAAKLATTSDASLNVGYAVPALGLSLLAAGWVIRKQVRRDQ